MRTYAIEIDVSPLRLVDDEDVGAVVVVLESWGLHGMGDSEELVADESAVTFTGFRDLSGGATPEDGHARLMENLPKFRVETRWRCTDYDQWDDTFGDINE